MNDDLQKYLPNATTVTKAADARAAKDRMRRALKDAPPPATAKDAPVSRRRRYPAWLMVGGALTAVLLPTSMALLVPMSLFRSRDADSAGAAPIGRDVEVAPVVTAVVTATSAAPEPSASPSASSSTVVTMEPKRQPSPKKKRIAKADAGAPGDQDPGLNE